jgi:hypothetical protein
MNRNQDNKDLARQLDEALHALHLAHLDYGHQLDLSTEPGADLSAIPFDHEARARVLDLLGQDDLANQARARIVD